MNAKVSTVNLATNTNPLLLIWFLEAYHDRLENAISDAERGEALQSADRLLEAANDVGRAGGRGMMGHDDEEQDRRADDAREYFHGFLGGTTTPCR